MREPRCLEDDCSHDALRQMTVELEAILVWSFSGLRIGNHSRLFSVLLPLFVMPSFGARCLWNWFDTDSMMSLVIFHQAHHHDPHPHSCTRSKRRSGSGAARRSTRLHLESWSCSLTEMAPVRVQHTKKFAELRTP